MNDTNETPEELDVKYFMERLRAIGFICAAALTEPNEEVSQRLAGMAQVMLDHFLESIPEEKAKDAVAHKIKAFAIQAHEEFEL